MLILKIITAWSIIAAGIVWLHHKVMSFVDDCADRDGLS